MTTLEILYFDGCPNFETYLPRLRELLRTVDQPVEVVEVRVASPDEAGHLGFLGSPTVRVAGRDVDPEAAGRTDFGLKCRLYASQGGHRGTPPDAWVIAAIMRAGANAG